MQAQKVKYSTKTFGLAPVPPALITSHYRSVVASKNVVLALIPLSCYRRFLNAQPKLPPE
jgi:hypothetical protein